jgi:hypothetical protein
VEGEEADERRGRAAEEPVPGGGVAEGEGPHGGGGQGAEGARDRRPVEEAAARLGHREAAAY